MIRTIIKIEEEKCNGCGLCAKACHEGAIEMVDGKARLIKDDYCDGLGDCLPVCPTGAISFEKREAAAYDEEAVQARQTQQGLTEEAVSPLVCGCPGSQAKAIRRNIPDITKPQHRPESCLAQWPVQIKLIPTRAPYLENADLLIAADCAAYAHGNFHQEFIKGRVTMIGCPKLDDGDYTEKLAEILSTHIVRSVTVVRMEVPCCGGIEQAARTAVQRCGKPIPFRTVVIGTDGSVISLDK